jgi:hypothetical protein
MQLLEGLLALFEPLDHMPVPPAAAPAPAPSNGEE